MAVAASERPTILVTEKLGEPGRESALDKAVNALAQCASAIACASLMHHLQKARAGAAERQRASFVAECVAHAVAAMQQGSGCRIQAVMAKAAMQIVSDRGALRLAGIELLQQIGDVDKAYNLTPEQLQEKIASADALIIRSATQASSAA